MSLQMRLQSVIICEIAGADCALKAIETEVDGVHVSFECVGAAVAKAAARLGALIAPHWII